MNKQLLILFVKNPQKGKVKTRLAATLGDDKALDIYLQLLERTKVITKDLPVDKVVYYSDFIDENDLWEAAHYQKALQVKTDLGLRMQAAFEQAFEKGYESVCIIGSDCYELDETILMQAFDALDKNEAVIGPANDGGYYLLGMKRLYPAFFTNKNWSTPTVFPDTIRDMEIAGISYSVLAELTDIDVEGDLGAMGG